MEVRMIGIAGPSGSGKSTLARRAQREWPEIEAIKLDKFFRNADEFPMSGKWRNWELPENLRFDELNHVLSELKAGREVEVPTYSKPEGRRTGMRVAIPKELVLVEGFLLYSQPRIRELFDLKIFLDVPIDVQLERRLKREPGFDREYFDQVMVPAFERNGADARHWADQVIDASADSGKVWREFCRAIGGVT